MPRTPKRASTRTSKGDPARTKKRPGTAPKKRAAARKSRRAPARAGEETARAPLDARLRTALAGLERRATRRTLEGMARYGLPAERALGVPVGEIQALARQLGRDHDLAVALWETGVYEARLLASFVDEPERVTPAQMDRWCRDFDNWGVCDTVCFVLFDRTPHAWARVEAWCEARPEFERRAAFALLASLAGHDELSGDAPFLAGLRRVEGAADDERNFVKKAVSWALRRIGRRNAALHAAAVEVARRLADSTRPVARWVGRDALRDLLRPAVTRRFAAAGPARGSARGGARGARRSRA